MLSFNTSSSHSQVCRALFLAHSLLRYCSVATVAGDLINETAIFVFFTMVSIVFQCGVINFRFIFFVLILINGGCLNYIDQHNCFCEPLILLTDTKIIWT